MEKKEDKSERDNGIDHAFDTFILLQTLIFATIFSYLTWLTHPISSTNLLAFTKVVRVFFIPILIIIIFWIFGHLSKSLGIRILFKTMAWYWSFLSFLMQAVFLGGILFWDILNPPITDLFLLITVCFTILFSVLVHFKFRDTYHEAYSLKIQVLSAIFSVISMFVFLIFVLRFG